MVPPLSVVIPLYDEEHRLARGVAGVEELRARLGVPVQAVWVDDGSRDATLSRARAAAGPDDVVLAEPHRGKGGALRAGVAVATGERLLLMDVDWSVAPSQIPLLLAEDADVVLATREGSGARRVGEPAWRHWLGRGFNHLVQHWLLAGHQDTQCGAKLLRRDIARALFSEVSVVGWAYDVELVYLAHRAGHTVREVPVVWRFEADSRLRPLRDGPRMAFDLWRVARRARDYRAR